MATWHQSRRPVRHGHPTQWCVVTDPPGGFASSMLFTTEESTKAFLASAPPHSYVIAPTGFSGVPVHAPKRTDPARYNVAVQSLRDSWQRFVEFNPSRAGATFVDVRHWSRGEYVATLKYRDSNTGGAVPINSAFQ